MAFCAGRRPEGDRELRPAARPGRRAARLHAPDRLQADDRRDLGLVPGRRARAGALVRPARGHRRAALGFTERRFGVPLIDGGTQRLPRIVGLGRALDLILTGRIVEAEEALAMGLLNEIVPDGRHLERALEMAEALARFPQDTMLADRRAAIEGIGLPLRRRGSRSRRRAASPTLETAWRGRGPLRRRRGPRRRRAPGSDAVSAACDRGLGPRTSPTGGGGRARAVLRRRAGRGVRPARPQRRGQDDHRRDPRGLPRAHGRRGARAGPRPRAPRPPAPGAGRDRAPELRLLPAATVREAVEHFAKAYPAPRDAGETIALVGLEEKADARTNELSGRPAAAPRPGARAGRRPRAGVPRRAHHRLRPRRPAHRLERRTQPPRPGQDGAADHPLPRRGAGAGRPRGDRQGRPHRGSRARPPSSGPDQAATASPTCPRAGAWSTRPTTPPTCSTA